MKILFLSDTHGNLPSIFNGVNLLGIDLIVFLGDNKFSDLELFKDIHIKKIGIPGNHLTKDNSILSKFGIEDISWKALKFKGKIFYGIPGLIKYTVCESVMERTKNFPVFGDLSIEIENLKKNISNLCKVKADVLISHFPLYGVMDRPKSMSHRGLHFLYDYVINEEPGNVFHGHLHENDFRQVNNTKVNQIFGCKVFDI